MSNMNDETFKTLIGDIKVGANTPQELITALKKYGENWYDEQRRNIRNAWWYAQRR